MDINIKQLSQESGVEIKGVVTKGEVITFLDLSKEDEVKVREALKTHIPQPAISQVKQLYDEIGTYVENRKVLSLSEYKLLGIKYC